MLDDKTRSLATELSVSAARLIRWLRAADPAPALTGAEASAMAVIVHTQGVTPSALADFERVKRPSITRVIDGLVARGLVRRDPHPEDGRASLLVATDRGQDLWQAGQLRTIAPLAERIAALTPAERDQLANVMPLLVGLMAPPNG